MLQGGKAQTIRSHVKEKHSMSSSSGKAPAGAARKVTPAGAGFAPGGAIEDHGTQGAVSELYRQHPKKWNDLGPHHSEAPGPNGSGPRG